MNIPSQNTKPHFLILDGLRGVAAVMVVAFHIFESNASSRFEQIINHGYLAVDFFFVLSGFVIGYAYDDRWGRMSIGSFFKRRLIRLQPMVIMGMIIGAICFYFQQSGLWPGISSVPVWKMLLIMLIGMTMVPVPTAMDIRGWQEMYPLNGPAWSLFFEYIANILYALFIRKFSKTVLSIFVMLAGAALIHLATTNGNGDVIGGWSLEPPQLRIGFTRLLYPFFAGLLLFRMGKLIRVKNAFGWCSLLIITALVVPRIGGSKQLWINGLYDSLVIIFLFPLIVYIGASGEITGKLTKRICRFFGSISYPVYIIHYPLIYMYAAWVTDNKVPMEKSLLMGLLVLVSSIAIAYACLKWYDEPIRKWLNKPGR